MNLGLGAGVFVLGLLAEFRMPGAIEDYAVIGNRETMAMVDRNGSIDWLGFPRFDSDACFAALLGRPEHGRWLITPVDEARKISRAYRDDTLVLETTFTTAHGSVVLIDCMTCSDGVPAVARLLKGIAGEVAVTMEMIVRFAYGALVPWVTRLDDGRLSLVGGAERLILSTPAPIRGEDLKTVASFTIKAGQEVPFVLLWAPSYRPVPESPEAAALIEAETSYWTEWARRHETGGCYASAVKRSLITLKALTHRETGGIVAAGTTSLPEALGGPRNWDYRFCWPRDSTFTLYALLEAGYTEEAEAWREWLLRAVAGSAAQMQSMYGIAGERRLPELEIDWLPGYEDSRPVRVGNAASDQLQLDVYGEILDSLYLCRRKNIAPSSAVWDFEQHLLGHLEHIWRKPDEGIWEVRGGARHFTHSKVMAWVAFDRAVRSIEEFGQEGPLDRWRSVRAAIHDDVCRNGFNPQTGSFVQHYGSTELDASLLLLPVVGFLPAGDARIRGTVAAIERTLMRDGFVLRYRSENRVDGVGESREGVFLPCTCWLADNYVLQGRCEEARALFERFLALRNDVGLLAEEYDPSMARLLGNFPQALTHVSLINTALNLTQAVGPSEHRGAKPAPEKGTRDRAAG